MADWRKVAGPGSFRGVPFFVDRAEQGGGRRVVRHEYPLSEAAPYSEDLGLQGRTFTVECYVLGADYLTKKEALISALEKPGPGPLVHPWYKPRTVSAAGFRVREERDRGGAAWFSIEFHETSSPAQPAAAVAPVEQLADTAAAAKVAIADEFTAAYDDFTSLRDSVSGSLRAASLAVSKITTKIQMEIQTAAALRKRLDDLSDNARALVNSPAGILDAVVGIVDALVEAILVDTTHPNPSGAVLDLYNYDAGVAPVASTATRAVELANFNATKRLVQRLALVNAAVVATSQVFVSYEDAVLARSAIADLLDAHLLEASDETAPSLTQLRADLVAAVPGTEGDLPKLLRYTPGGISVSSLVLTHRLYGRLNLESDLIARNRIGHPGFVPGDLELEVLSRD